MSSPSSSARMASRLRRRPMMMTPSRTNACLDGAESPNPKRLRAVDADEDDVSAAKHATFATVLCFAVFLSSVFVVFTLGRQFDSITGSNNKISFSDSETAKKSLSSSLPSTKENRNCRLYLAPSSLPYIHGLGLFTTQPIIQGQFFLSQETDGPNIPVVDYDVTPNNYALQKERQAWISLFDNYWWGRGVADQVSYEAALPHHQVYDFQVTFGALPNHHCILESIDLQWPAVPYDDSMVNRTKDPGAGAFSYHTGRNFVAMRDLDAGDELFLNYGHCDRGDEDLPDWTDNMPMTDDYMTAAKGALFIWNKRPPRRSENTTAQTTMSNDNWFTLAYHEAIIRFGAKATKHAIGLLPTNVEQLNEIMRFSKPDSDRPLRLLVAQRLATYMGTNRRTIEWIMQHGVCVENIVPGPSRIRQAGQGALAQWLLPRGEIIVPVPLLHIMNRDVLAIYDNKGKQVGTQLLLNYCFGHQDSSLLLCPDTNVILINHCGSRSKENEKDQCGSPNAKLQWASGWDLGDNKKWLELSLDEISQQPGRGLALEVVATRQILPGEEIFLDYGNGWEDAWNRHVQTWRPVSNATWLSIKHLNNDTRGPVPMLVSGDLRRAERHREVFTGCIYWPTKEDDADEYSEKNVDWTKMSDEDILQTYSDSGKRFRGNYTTHQDGAYWPCAVLMPENETHDTYVVRIYQSPFFDSILWNENDVPRLLTGYPRSSIHYFREPFQQDQMLPNVFRHFIEIPDDIFPEQWKDRRATDWHQS